MTHKQRLMALLLTGLAGTIQAGEKDELLKLRNTTTNLIKQLVKQGVLTEQAAAEMIKQAEADAVKQVADSKTKQEKPEKSADEVRVAYVPDFVKDEIRQQVRHELREEVVGDVMQKAKNEQWGLPNALPEWTKRFKLSGDIRLRNQGEYMAKDNQSYANSLIYLDSQTINDRGGFAAAGLDRTFNTTDDRNRFRERIRLGIDASVTEGLKAGIRLATGNQRDPVSTNQTLGNTGRHYEFAVDRAYLEYEAMDDNKFKWLTLAGGRVKNPWYTGGGEFTGGSELVWDTDLSFEGFYATARHRLDSVDGVLDTAMPSSTLFFTAGAFPLQETSFGSDKWLLGGQTGIDWHFDNQDTLKLAGAYFDYVGMNAKPNLRQNRTCDLNNRAENDSAPQYMQSGNTLVAICRDGSNANPSVFPGLLGLASDYNIVNLNASYESKFMAPYSVRISGDYARNIGYSLNKVGNADLYVNGGYQVGRSIKPQTTAWQVRGDFGWPTAEMPGHWNVFAAYKYVGRDAVLDAFTDSDFHLGGTNVKGWFMGANYGLMKNVWLTGRWLTADVITGPPFGLDVLQIDINTKF